jgi:serine O-acetyltransferase
MSTLDLIKSDYRAWRQGVGALQTVSQEGLWVTVIYRIRHRLNADPPVPGRLLLRALLYPIAKFMKLLVGASLNPAGVIGPGFRLIHGGSVFLGGQMVMGAHCMVYHEVTIGPSALRSMDYPVIGDRVRIFPGAKILGGITIGDDAVIGANSVVIEDVPAGAVVAGNPARIVRTEERGGDKIGADPDEPAPNAN